MPCHDKEQTVRNASLARALLVPGVVLVLTACGRADARETTVTDDLRRDLDLAQASVVQLAPAGATGLTVSAVERTPVQAPSTGRRVSTARTPRRAPVAAADPESVPDAAGTEEPAVETGTVASDAPSIDLAEARLPTTIASGGGDGEGDRGGVGGAIIGAIGGVIIRGGGVGGGHDDCEIHPIGGRRIPPGGVLGPVLGGTGVIVDRRVPRGAGRPTF